MRRTSLAMGIWLGLVSTLPILGVLYAGEAVAGLPYPPYLLFEWLTRILPGPLVTFGIDLMVGLITAIGIGPTSAVAKIAEMALAVTGMFLGAAFLGAALTWFGRRRPRALLIAGAAGGAAVWALTVVARREARLPERGRASGPWPPEDCCGPSRHSIAPGACFPSAAALVGGRVANTQPSDYPLD